MKKEGQIVLFEFPRGDLIEGKLRPALLLSKLPGSHQLWMMCMISTRLQQKVDGFDEIIAEKDEEFTQTGLKATSLIRLGRLAVVDDHILKGTIGKINSKRLTRLKRKIADWLVNKTE